MNEVVPALFLGRRLRAEEAGRFVDAAVLDLASEFVEVGSLRRGEYYLSISLLDATAPTFAQLNSAVEWISRHIAHRPVFIHCALGQGRSACVVLAYLLHVGRVKEVREGLVLLRGIRPGVGLTPCQRQMLLHWQTGGNPRLRA